MKSRVAPIVEGHGEVEALPLLLRRIGLELIGVPVEVVAPWRVARSAMLGRPGELERIASARRIQAGPGGLVLLLLDADEDCPVALAPELTRRIERPLDLQSRLWWLAASTRPGWSRRPSRWLAVAGSHVIWRLRPRQRP